MPDVHNVETRSRNMAAIKAKNTKPELIIRHRIHAKGFRYRLHSSDLPGKPDIVFPRHKSVILVNGCFWHGHDCELFRWPATRKEFWHNKISRTREVDARNIAALTNQGWRVLTSWECALKGRQKLSIDNVIEQSCDWIVSGKDNYEIAGRSCQAPSEHGLTASS